MLHHHHRQVTISHRSVCQDLIKLAICFKFSSGESILAKFSRDKTGTYNINNI